MEQGMNTEQRGLKPGLSRSFALPVGRGSCRAVTLPCLIRVSSVANVGHGWVLRAVYIGRSVEREGVIKCITVRHLVLAGSVAMKGGIRKGVLDTDETPACAGPSAGRRMEHGKREGAKMGLSRSFAPPVGRGSCRAVTLPSLIRDSSKANVGHGWILRMV